MPLVPCSNRNKKASATTNHILKYHSPLNTLGSKFLSMVSFYTFYILQFYPYQAFDIFNKSIKYEINCQEILFWFRYVYKNSSFYISIYDKHTYINDKKYS